MNSLKICDEMLGQELQVRFSLMFSKERITVRDVIEHRVRHEVEEFNSQNEQLYHGLIQPTEAESLANGYRLKRKRMVDADKQVEIAVTSFQNGGFIVLVDDKQIEALEDQINIHETRKVVFLKLIPLVGG